MMLLKPNTMLVEEIFDSVQGEGPLAGEPTIFLRVWGCNRTCTWCDTGYTAPGAKGTNTRKRMSMCEIAEEISNFPCRSLCVTGGEPLLYFDFLESFKELYTTVFDSFTHVTAETNGEMLGGVYERALSFFTHIVCSPKLSSAGKKTDMRWLGPNVCGEKKLYLKYVIASAQDWDEFREQYDKYRFDACKNPIYLQPADPALSYKVLLALFHNAPLPNVRIMPQIHKAVGLR